MYSYQEVWKHADKAISDENYLNELVDKHNKLFNDLNKTMISFKSKGHVMGSDLRNKNTTPVYVPLRHDERTPKKEFKDITRLKTIRLDHRITTKLIESDDVHSIFYDLEHIDHDFAKMALLCREVINTSRVLKRVELKKGELLRNYVFSIKRSDNKFDYY